MTQLFLLAEVFMKSPGKSFSIITFLNCSKSLAVKRNLLNTACLIYNLLCYLIKAAYFAMQLINCTNPCDLRNEHALSPTASPCPWFELLC